MYTVHFALNLLAPAGNVTLPGWFLQRTKKELQTARATGLMLPSAMAVEVVATLTRMGLRRETTTDGVALARVCPGLLDLCVCPASSSSTWLLGCLVAWLLGCLITFVSACM
jgi:hypothetical protein